jgi:hypothetical protein
MLQFVGIHQKRLEGNRMLARKGESTTTATLTIHGTSFYSLSIITYENCLSIFMKCVPYKYFYTYYWCLLTNSWCVGSYIYSPVFTVNNSENMDEGCAIGQMVRYWFLTIKPWFKSKVTSCEIDGDWSDSGTVFFFVNYLPPPSYHATLAAYSSEVCDSHDQTACCYKFGTSVLTDTSLDTE